MSAVTFDLKYKPNTQQYLTYWNSFWNDSKNTRPSVTWLKRHHDNVTMPNTLKLVDGYPMEKFGDELELFLESVVYCGDFIPGLTLTFGADHFAALLGAKLIVDAQNSTTWIEHCVSDWSDVNLKLDWNNPIGQLTLRATDYLRRRFDGKIIISPPHLQANLDCLVALRGVQPLLYDLVDAPDKVHKALEQVNLAFADTVEVMRQIFDTDKYGAINRHCLYQPGFPGVLQCDFSCMISPDMFVEFVLPNLKFEAATVDYAEYHLDGPGAIVHTEAICSIDEIKLIQWQPGAALLNQDWRELYLKIDRLGKGNYFYAPSLQLAQWIKGNLNQKNLCLDMNNCTCETCEKVYNMFA